MGLLPSWKNIKASAQGWKNIVGGQTWQGTAPIHKGSWGTPDVGISEIWRPYEVKAQEKKVNWRPESNYPAGTYNSLQGGTGGNPSSPSGANDGGGGGGGGGGDNGLQQQVDQFGAMIDRDYEIAMGSLGNQETSLRSQGDLAQAQISNEGAAAQTSLGAEQATKEGSAQSTLASAETEGVSAMQQAREIDRGLNRRNIAQLSALGISSSSVAEAMAETLGVETARRIAGITGSISEIRTNTVKELGRIKNFFAEKTTQLKESMRIETGKIQQSLIAGINQINTARQQAASDKAQRRQELFTNAQNALTALATQKQQFEQSLKQWAAQKSSALSSVLNQDQFNAMMQKQQGVLASQYDPTQYNITPGIGVSSTGGYSGSWDVQPKDRETMMWEEAQRKKQEASNY